MSSRPLPEKSIHKLPVASLLGAMAWLSLSPTTTIAADGTWTNETTTSSLWATASNWLNGIAASGAGSTATITVANSAATKSISLNSTTQTIGILNIGNPNGTGIYQLNTGALIFDNNGSSAQINIASGSGGIIFASALTNTINDSLLISQNSASLFTNNSTYTGGSGSDNKVIEHAGTGTGGVALAGVIADGATGTVSVRQNNANGTMTLRGINTYTGGTVVDAGTLALGAGNNRLAATGAVTINGGTFNLGAFSHTVGAVAINGGTVTNGTLSGSSYAVTGGTITAILGGSGSTLTKSGAGTTTLSGVNTYTGGTAINGGVLRISSRDNFANRLLSFDGGTLEATTNISGFTSANNTTLNAGGGAIRVGESMLVDWGSAKLTGTGALTKEGAGTLVIASGAVANDYSGGTFLNEGVLSISRATALGTNTSTVTFNGGILQSTASITTARATTLNASGGTFEVASGTTNTWNGAIGGLGSLNKSGSGALVIGGNGGYSGTTTVSAGSLIVGATGSVGGSSVLDVSSGATLDVSAVTSGFVVGSSQSLRGGGTVVGNITIDGILAPGNSIGTLTTVGDVTWNAGNSWIFELGGAGPSIGSPGTSDLLTVGGDFLRGSGSAWTFDFAGTGAFGWYKLAEWSGTSDFEVLNFSGVNLGSGFDSEFAIQDSVLYVNVVPEPSTYMLLLLAGAGLGIRILRRREA